jgi:hypothetical protein
MLMLPSLVALALVPSLVFTAPQDKKIQSFGGTETKAEASLWVFTEDFQLLGALSIAHGTPDWKKEHEEKFDEETKGKVWRFGKNNWTTLDAMCPVNIGGKDIPAGMYYLGISRSKDDKWSLVFVDPAKVRGTGISPFSIDKAPVAFEAPLTYAKTGDDKPITQKLWVNLKKDAAAPTKATLEIRWGNHSASAPVELKVAAAAAKDASTPKKEK